MIFNHKKFTVNFSMLILATFKIGYTIVCITILTVI